MNRHLDEETLSAVVAGLQTGEEAREHLASCVFCRRRIDQAREMIESRRLEIEEEAPDWDEHREGILEAIAAENGDGIVAARHRWMRSALALAACLVIALTVGLLTHDGPIVVQDEIPIEEILAEVDDVLANDEVPGFEGLAELVPDAEELATLAGSPLEEMEG